MTRGTFAECVVVDVDDQEVELDADHGGLLGGVAVFHLVELPAHFVVDGLLHELEAVQVKARAVQNDGVAPLRSFLFEFSTFKE